MGELAIMNGTGDTKVIWDPENEAEVKNAREMFDNLVKGKGFAAWSVNKKGNKDERVTKFDPAEEKLILVPPMAGG